MRTGYAQLLDKAKYATARLYRRLFSRRAAGGLTSSEVLDLYLIDLLDGPTIKDFAAFLDVSQPNATYKVNALTEKGYVEKRPSATDRREYHLFTTKKCKKFLKEGGSGVEELETALRARFTDAQLETAREVFDALLELLDAGDPS